MGLGTGIFNGFNFNIFIINLILKDMIFKDLDGSLAGNPGDVVVAQDNITLLNPSCRNTGQFDNGVACSNTTTWIRFSFDEYVPSLAVSISFLY